MCWLWLVFWCAAFTLKDEDHVRFTILLHGVNRKTRRFFAVISGVCIVTAFAYAIPPTWDFVSFMAIEKTSLLKIRFDIVFFIYLVFAVAIIGRYGRRVIAALRDTQHSSWR